MKKALFILILALMMVSASMPVFAEATGDKEITKDKYDDISSHWARDAINKVADDSIFTGNGGKFEPNKPITRSEFALMLHKALGIQIMYFKATDISDYYDDVKNEDPVASPLNDLVVANIIDYKGSFKPEEALPRDDMVHFIINSLEYMTGGNYAMIEIYPEPFADDSDINPAYRNDFVKAQVLKLVYGTGNGLFLPKSGATRAEAATVIYRLQNLLQSLKVDEEVQVIPSVGMGTDSINLKMIIANNTKNKVTINHSSGQKYDFEILDAERNVLYRWSADKLFIAELGSTVLEPGESIEFSDTIQQEDLMDKAVYMKAYIIGESQDFTINTEGYEIPIGTTVK
ncbi:MAG: S-layer protein [Ruminiclostridium sp.]|nr:S-layer protein [Ruminiclostridium sp.]